MTHWFIENRDLSLRQQQEDELRSWLIDTAASSYLNKKEREVFTQLTHQLFGDYRARRFITERLFTGKQLWCLVECCIPELCRWFWNTNAREFVERRGFTNDQICSFTDGAGCVLANDAARAFVERKGFTNDQICAFPDKAAQVLANDAAREFVESRGFTNDQICAVTDKAAWVIIKILANDAARAFVERKGFTNDQICAFTQQVAAWILTHDAAREFVESREFTNAQICAFTRVAAWILTDDATRAFVEIRGFTNDQICSFTQEAESILTDDAAREFVEIRKFTNAQICAFTIDNMQAIKSPGVQFMPFMYECCNSPYVPLSLLMQERLNEKILNVITTSEQVDSYDEIWQKTVQKAALIGYQRHVIFQHLPPSMPITDELIDVLASPVSLGK